MFTFPDSIEYKNYTGEQIGMDKINEFELFLDFAKTSCNLTVPRDYVTAYEMNNDWASGRLILYGDGEYVFLKSGVGRPIGEIKRGEWVVENDKLRFFEDSASSECVLM